MYKKVFFSMDAENSPLFIGYYDEGAIHYGGWPTAFLPKSSAELLVKDNERFRAMEAGEYDIMEFEGEVLKIVLDPDNPEMTDTARIAATPITLEDGAKKHIYEISRYCWHVDEYDDIVKQIATEFSRILREWHTPEQMDEINRLNSELVDDSICNSHTYFDANEAMIGAFEKVMNCPLFPYLEDETLEELYNNHLAELYGNLTNAAWTIAKNNKFSVK